MEGIYKGQDEITLVLVAWPPDEAGWRGPDYSYHGVESRVGRVGLVSS